MFEITEEVSLNQIITIGREFGSGGREIGRRLSELLGYAYYDKEIVTEISHHTQLAEDYVRQIIDQKPNLFFSLSTGRTLHAATTDYILKQQTAVYAEQTRTLKEMAKKSPCIIVGRCADFILRELSPLRLFVYADMSSKVIRCRERGEEMEHLTEKQLIGRIRKVDRNRAKYYRYYTGQKWGDRTNYDISINTSTIPPETVAELLAKLIREKK